MVWCENPFIIHSGFHIEPSKTYEPDLVTMFQLCFPSFLNSYLSRDSLTWLDTETIEH